MIVLIDCDNFFASCERIMQPRLAQVPVAVLSNNDGCVIARSAEVKQAGVAMGQPYHECKIILDRINATVVSANFLLYRHFAKRLQTILRTIPNTSVEVYSIDESFLDVPTESAPDKELWAATLKQTVYDWTGIPVSIGIAPTRALAKLATRLAKKSPTGLCVLGNNQSTDTEQALKSTDVADVWGIGRRLGPKLRVCGVQTAWDLMQLDISNPALRLLDKPVLNLIYELRGWPTFIDTGGSQRKSIMHSRSFGTKVTGVDELRAVFVDFSSHIAQKLRKQGLVTDNITFSVRYKDAETARIARKSLELGLHWTNNTFDFAQLSDAAARQLFEPNKQYTKAMVYCGNLRACLQLDFYEQSSERVRKASLMAALDELETRYGAAGPYVATKLLNDSWKGKRQFVSPYNHAHWNSLPPVYTT